MMEVSSCMRCGVNFFQFELKKTSVIGGDKLLFTVYGSLLIS